MKDRNNISTMKRQIVVIGGGTSFDTHDDYIAFLKTRDVDAETMKYRNDWKASLDKKLGDAYEVLVPNMPNKTNARYDEWCIWFDRCIPFLHDGVILIGHSLGGIFLAKYLSERTFPLTIRATLLVAPPFDSESLTFTLPESLERFATQGGDIILLYSKDDPIVSYEERTLYQAAIPKARLMAFEDKGHFVAEEFPELVDCITALQP